MLFSNFLDQNCSYICWKEPSDARMDPPIQDPYRLSWGPLAAISLNLMVDGVLMLRSLLSLSMKPLRQVLPPVTTTLPYRAGLKKYQRYQVTFSLVISPEVHVTHAHTGGDHVPRPQHGPGVSPADDSCYKCILIIVLCLC